MFGESMCANINYPDMADEGCTLACQPFMQKEDATTANMP
jgi:hypothetical protein